MSSDKSSSSTSLSITENGSGKPSPLPNGSAPQDISGQSLEGFTEQEWEKGAAAKPAEQLKMENTPNTVNVFVGPKETIERVVMEPSKPGAKDAHYKANGEKGDPIAQLVNRVAHLLTTERDDAQTEVSVTVKIRPEQRKPVKQNEK